MCVTFDRKEPTFRHLAYADYKAQRKGMPEELAVQMPVLKEVLDAMNIPCYELAGWEADDLIGTISRRCEAAGWDCRVATGGQGLPAVGHRPYLRGTGYHPHGKDYHPGDGPRRVSGDLRLCPGQMVDLKA